MELQCTGPKSCTIDRLLNVGVKLGHTLEKVLAEGIDDARKIRRGIPQTSGAKVNDTRDPSRGPIIQHVICPQVPVDQDRGIRHAQTAVKHWIEMAPDPLLLKTRQERKKVTFHILEELEPIPARPHGVRAWNVVLFQDRQRDRVQLPEKHGELVGKALLDWSVLRKDIVAMQALARDKVIGDKILGNMCKDG